jgi:hypothetical protein
VGFVLLFGSSPSLVLIFGLASLRRIGLGHFVLGVFVSPFLIILDFV